jgi:topoisomerase-4 subunit A
LEKWDPKKPLSAIYWEGEKELFYVKRFFIEHPDREETIITDHPNSYLEKIFTDYRPMAEVVFAKKRGQEREENMELNLEEFIAVKGITAMGNQLTKEKVLEINTMEPLLYEPPAPVEPEEIDVVDEEDIDSEDENHQDENKSDDESDDENDSKIDEGGQGLLF